MRVFRALAVYCVGRVRLIIGSSKYSFFLEKNMTVKELRDLLNGYPDDVVIFICDKRDNINNIPFGDIDSIDYDYINQNIYLEAHV